MRYIILGIILGLIFVLSVFELNFRVKKKPKNKNRYTINRYERKHNNNK